MALLVGAFIILSVKIDFFFPPPTTGLTLEDIPTQQAFINISSGTNPGAPIDLIEFSDFGCVFSVQSYPGLKQVVEEYGESINFVFKHMPQESMHPNAFAAAAASECARDQGRFMDYHDALFEARRLDSSLFSSIAEVMDLDIEEFESCIESGEKSERIMRDMKEAQANNIMGTPVFIINGDMFIGSQDYDSLREAIEKQLNPEQITLDILRADIGQ